MRRSASWSVAGLETLFLHRRSGLRGRARIGDPHEAAGRPGHVGRVVLEFVVVHDALGVDHDLEVLHPGLALCLRAAGKEAHVGDVGGRGRVAFDLRSGVGVVEDAPPLRHHGNHGRRAKEGFHFGPASDALLNLGDLVGVHLHPRFVIDGGAGDEGQEETGRQSARELTEGMVIHS